MLNLKVSTIHLFSTFVGQILILYINEKNNSNSDGHQFIGKLQRHQ